jgi:hypothetical protein
VGDNRVSGKEQPPEFNESKGLYLIIDNNYNENLFALLIG